MKLTRPSRRFGICDYSPKMGHFIVGGVLVLWVGTVTTEKYRFYCQVLCKAESTEGILVEKEEKHLKGRTGV